MLDEKSQNKDLFNISTYFKIDFALKKSLRVKLRRFLVKPNTYYLMI